MAEILYAPNRETVVTSNAWAFLQWLRTVHGVDLDGWAALQRFSAEHPGTFGTAMTAFARLPNQPLRLARRCGTPEALVLRRADGRRIAFSGEAIRNIGVGVLPPEVAAPLERLWPTSALIRPLADLLLHADLRRDDRLLATGPAWPWPAALLEGTTVILTAADPAALLATAAEEAATVVVAPARSLAEAAFRRPRHRPDLRHLRTIVATGGPLSPEGRRRIYTWVKSDLMLFARTGDTLWGNPLEPVLARPPATPALLTPPASTPATP
ncbi:MAG TPA: hypothetical protein VGI78_22390 [Acetobacteraceae bacterium]|jgi:hypothetical protein